MPAITTLDTVDSTSSYITAMMPDAPHATVVEAREQTAGRGQRGNSWEADPGMNVTMSVVVRPRHLDPRRQFVISQATALALCDILDPLLAPAGLKTAVKWPNDIYVNDMKISGTLIECSLTRGHIDRCIIGIGVNINQQEFHSPAPNPVSLAMLTSQRHDVDHLTRRMAEAVIAAVEAIDTDDDDTAAEAVRARYRDRLWRGEGLWQWRDTATGETFTAAVADILPTGHLVMSDGRQFAFKEVSPIVSSNPSII